MTDGQHKDDLGRVSQQNSATDMVRGVEDGPRGGLLDGLVRAAFDATPFGRAVSGRTDFDKRDLDLNKMIDLVEETDPADLESSGKALWDARDAVKAAADELDGHIDQVHWVGESGDAFRKWGAKLVTNTHHLSDFAGAAGDQITAAAVGLSSVRGAMPARDTQAGRKRPEHFTAAEKTADKDAYDAAVKVEKNRQEAINQMNRLASYYAVSEEVLASLPAEDKMPEFTSMPDVGVPQPSPRDARGENHPGVVGGTHRSTEAAPGGGGHHATVVSGVHPHTTVDAVPSMTDVSGTTRAPDQPVSTNIDSTATLPSPTLGAGPGPALPTAGAPGTHGGQPSMFDGGFRLPTANGLSSRGTSGPGGLRTPPSAQGRAATSGVTNPGGGRGKGQGPFNQMGRATTTGQTTSRETGTGSKSPTMGRGVTGGPSRAAGSSTFGPNGGQGGGAGRPNGVVGGRARATGGAQPSGGSRIPRGTVIGSEGVTNSRSSGARPGQGGRPGASKAVTGKPTERSSRASAERNGMTRGGAGLTRGSRREKPGDEETQGTPRPDYLVEDDETHLSEKHRRGMPPVID
ncbi:hypothetical protein [Streptomyces sp. NPDC048202]|uniref:WXG100 family type VII secretion target n=1 Tax=Streptomyces sp. NPDC048202 TaxID=3365514 RepID=UPI0037204275